MSETPPLWWRGTHPPLGAAVDDPTTLRGEVSRSDIASMAERPPTLQPLWFEQAHAHGLTISLDDRHLMAAWSEFEDCTRRLPPDRRL